MSQSIFSGTRSEQLRFFVLLAFLFLCLIGGGASRPDVLSLLYLRPAAILCMAAILLTPGPFEFRRYRALLAMLLAMAVVIGIQLIPLPPDLWLSMPGHQRYAEAIALGGPDAWHPISLTPDLTINALVALVVPLAVLIGYAAIRPDQRVALLPVLIIGAAASAVLGVIQLGAGNDSPAYLYRVSHQWSPDGFFSNRNHQAALLAMAFPMLGTWTMLPAANDQKRRVRFWTAVLLGLFLVPVLLACGSRAGIALGLVGLASLNLLGRKSPKGDSTDRRRRLMQRGLLTAALVALAAVVVFFGRAASIQRLFGQEIQSDLRVENTPLMLRMVGDFFPFGTGFGSFDPVFRGYELDQSLDPLYFNRAHNDLIELALTGGLPALLLLAVFLIWLARHFRAAFARRPGRSAVLLLGRTAAIMVAMLLMASIVDYPLRTPLMGAIFIIACCWLADARAAGVSEEVQETSLKEQRLALKEGLD